MRIRGFRKGYNQTSLLGYRDYIEKIISLVLVDAFQLATRSSADPEGGQGFRTPPPLENHMLYSFYINRVGNLRTECAFSQVEYELRHGPSKQKKLGHNRPASNHSSFRFWSYIDRNTSLDSFRIHFAHVYIKVVNLLDRSRENLILLHANKSAYQTAHPLSDPRIG